MDQLYSLQDDQNNQVQEIWVYVYHAAHVFHMKEYDQHQQNKKNADFLLPKRDMYLKVYDHWNRQNKK